MSKKMKNTFTRLILVGLLVLARPGFAQQVTNGHVFNLQQAIHYALENHTSIKNAKIQSEIAKSRIGQIRSVGLPQINGSADLGNNVVLQKTLIDPNTFGPRATTSVEQVIITQQQINSNQDIILNPKLVTTLSDTPQPPRTLAFGLKYAGSAAMSASQLLFDGSYLIGLKAAKVYTDLSSKQAQQTEIEVIDQVTKAYYSVLVSRERLALLDRNISRLENQLRELKEINKQGFAEKIDVDRLQVAFNNLKVEKEKASRLVALGVDLLKFQMGMDLNQSIELTDKLDAVMAEAKAVATENFNYSNRIEYSVLETQRDLANLDIKNKQAGYYPKLLVTGRYGYSGSSNSFSELIQTRTEVAGIAYPNWFNFAFVGLSLQVPIFDGFRKKYEIQQARLTLETVTNGFKTLQQGIDLQLRQSNTNLQNALQVLESQKQNLALAEEIARVSTIKYKEGVGSSLEVINAETELRLAQTNYYSALYDIVIAKVELEKATGTLKK